MKKLLLMCIITMMASSVIAAEKKAIKDVSIDEFTSDTQVALKGAGDKHVALTWWIPNEYWEAILSRDKSTSEKDKQAMLNAVSGISILAVVQADISSMGAFQFYTKEEVENKMSISYTNKAGKSEKLQPLKEIAPDLKIVIGIFKPILSAAMGNLGKNMHFYILNDKATSSQRLIDPYLKGNLHIELTKRNNDTMSSDMETPLNSLFIPRKCPNGKGAHISWNYCPWSGTKLN